MFDYIRKHRKGYELDFIKVWNNQGLYLALEKQLATLCDETYEFITRDDRLTENVTEWCKKEVCWERAQNTKWTFHESFLNTLIPQTDLVAEVKEAKNTQKLMNEVDALKFIIASGSAYWQQVLSWGLSRRLLSEMEISILKMVINIEKTGRIPSEKQAKVVTKARERLITEGMPLQF
jgi:hypothetical protein